MDRLRYDGEGSARALNIHGGRLNFNYTFRLDTFIHPVLEMPSRVEVENNTIDNYIFIYMLVVVIVDVLWRRKDIGGGDVASDGQRRVSTVCRVRLVSRHEMSQGKHGTKRHNHHWSQSHW